MTMCRTRVLVAICTIAVTLGAACALQAAPRQGPCVEIFAACQQAGFVRGGARSGDGLQVDCVRPIMQGTPQRPRASKPLPQIDPQLVSACKASNPNFGQRNRLPPAGAEPPANAPPPAGAEPPAVPPRAAASPVAPNPQHDAEMKFDWCIF
jgi:hypothetical protein